MEMQPSNHNKPTSVISWIGCGLAITVLLLIWFVNILVFNWMGGAANPIAGLYMLLFFVGGILGVMALIFSIIGLIMAIKNNTPRWIGTLGIIICVVSILSFFVPIVCAGFVQKKTVQIETPDYLEEKADTIVDDVTIQIYSLGRVRCINNSSTNTVVGNMRTSDHDFKSQLANWLKMNNVDSTTIIAINSSTDAEYSDVSKVFDALKENGITKFRLLSDLTTADYYN